MEQVAMSVREAFALAVQHHQAGRLAQAEAVYRIVLQTRPDHPGANHNLGLVALAAGQSEDACRWIGRAVASEPGQPAFRDSLVKALRAYLAGHPDDALGAGVQLAALGADAAPERASPAQMLALYAARASTWPSNAWYRAPQLVAEAVVGRMTAPGVVLDAGCGTGLVGPLVKPMARRLVGVDLSPDMLQIAREAGVYDELACEDLIQHLDAHPSAYDAIASAATLIHFGDLAPVLSASAKALRPGGVFAFTAFPNDRDPDGYGVEALDAAQGGVFFHGRAYVARALEAAGLELLSMTDEPHESRDHQAVMGLLVVCRR